jgi:hypothetical protein
LLYTKINKNINKQHDATTWIKKTFLYRSDVFRKDHTLASTQSGDDKNKRTVVTD